MTEELLTRVEDGVLVATLNRPEAMNAMTTAMMDGLGAALARAAEDPDIGCLVLTGAGRGFCAGGDVKGMASGSRTRGITWEEQARSLRVRMELSRTLHELSVPTICMLNGVAAGAGMSLALACDMRIAGASARMTTAFAKVGLSGDYGGHWYLNRLVGPSKARELYFTSAMLDAAKIEQLGLAMKVVPDDQLEAETMALAKQLANGPRVTWVYMKQNMKVAENGTLSELLDTEAIGMTRCRNTEDHKEASKAFVEKRKPVFKGC